MPELVGRERELATIDLFLDRAEDDLAVLTVEGPAGIGKSVLLAAASERAVACGMRVIQSRPVAAEARLAFASLTDLLGPAADEGLDVVPEPQRIALEMALLRRGEPGARVLPRAVGAGALTVLRRLASEQPTLLVIDDAQWMDAASASVIGFALRRLEGSHVGLLVARRLEADRGHGNLRALEGLPSERVTVVQPQPLSLSGTFHVLRTTLGMRPSRPILRRIHSASGGNPLLAIELGRAVEASGSVLAPDSPMPVTETIRSLMARRIGDQTTSARRAMLILALLSTPTESMLRRVDRRAPGSVERLVGAGVLERRDGALRFAHPLLTDVALSWYSRDEIRAMHRRLAGVVIEPEAKARHRALGLDGPDATVAAELTEAAEAAATTSVEVACELLEIALTVTPTGDDETEVIERQMALARLRRRAGDTLGAVGLLDDLLARLPPGVLRARALEQRAQLDWVMGGDQAISRCEEALSYPGVEGWLRARLLVTRARLTLDPHVGLSRATEALACISELAEPDVALMGEALAAEIGSRAALGFGFDWPTVDRALALEVEAPPEEVSDRVSASMGSWLKYAGDLERARTWLRRTRDTAVAEGDEGSLPYALSHLPQLELWTGHWEAAYQAAQEHLAVAEWTGQQEQRLTAIYSLALVDAHAGRLDLARTRVLDALPEAERTDPWNVYQLLATLGFVELAAGQPAAAIAHLTRAHEIYEESGAGDATVLHENLAEALVAAADLERASSFIAEFVERASRLGRPINMGPALRARAVLEAATGDLATASDSVRAALEQHERVAMPFSRARTLLAAGQIERRRGERRAARDALEEAKSIFDRLGAPTWSARAAEELGRIPMRRAAGPDELTASERRVAELVADGLTNREVAAQLFVTPKTVETNLTRVYAKLGIRSRSQLVARLRAEREDASKL